jgi:hypothetical protein
MLLFIIHTNIKTHTPTSLSSRLSRSIFLLTVIQLSLIICITSAYAAQVTLGWSPGTEPDLTGYKVYYGTASRNYTQSVDINNRTVTSCTITNLTEGQTYYFAATAYNTSLVESPYSAEVSCLVNAATTTTTPGNRPPKANAGINKKTKVGTTLALNGSMSYDLKGKKLQYSWRIISGPDNYILENETKAKATFKPLEVGTYEIGLTVFNGNHYSEEDSVTITVKDNSSDNSVKVWCPFFFLTNNDMEKITLLRDFRNNVLLKTPIGRKYVWLFYKNAIELITILINNEGIADQSKLVLEGLLPKIKSAVEGQKITITSFLLLEIEDILKQISFEASGELKQAIEKLREDLREEKMLDAVGIDVDFLN